MHAERPVGLLEKCRYIGSGPHGDIWGNAGIAAINMIFGIRLK